MSARLVTLLRCSPPIGHATAALVPTHLVTPLRRSPPIGHATAALVPAHLVTPSLRGSPLISSHGLVAHLSRYRCARPRSFRYTVTSLAPFGHTFGHTCAARLAQAPTLSLIGIPWKIIPFPQFELQSKWVARVLSGRVTLPTQAEMEEAVREVGSTFVYFASLRPGYPANASGGGGGGQRGG
eukprot:5034129-Pyramimonas_sp.AAC.1